LELPVGIEAQVETKKPGLAAKKGVLQYLNALARLMLITRGGSRVHFGPQFI